MDKQWLSGEKNLSLKRAQKEKRIAVDKQIVNEVKGRLGMKEGNQLASFCFSFQVRSMHSIPLPHQSPPPSIPLPPSIPFPLLSPIFHLGGLSKFELAFACYGDVWRVFNIPLKRFLLKISFLYVR